MCFTELPLLSSSNTVVGERDLSLELAGLGAGAGEVEAGAGTACLNT